MDGIYTKNLWLYNLATEALLLRLTTLVAYIFLLSLDLKTMKIIALNLMELFAKLISVSQLILLVDST